MGLIENHSPLSQENSKKQIPVTTSYRDRYFSLNFHILIPDNSFPLCFNE
jgi:hypothetical protein